MNNSNKPLMLTINPTAERVGLSAYIIRKWALNGTIKAIRAGNKIYINNDSLDEYLNSNILTAPEEQDGVIKPVDIREGLYR